MTHDQIVLVDAHVHFHPGADTSRLLAAAVSNFSLAARQMRAGSKSCQGVLMLAEMSGVDWFGSVLSQAGRCIADGWRASASSAESVSLHLMKDDGSQLFVVAGCQIVTAEGIEVLALGTRDRIADRMPMATTLDAVRTAGAIAVLPWGAGKWLGKRGKLVNKLFGMAGEIGLYAGDNGGRPVFWPRPRVFRIAESQGRAVLPGTDPLPLAGEERRVGQVGFWVAGALSMDAPMAMLRSILEQQPPDTVHSYGKLESPWAFVRNQLALRVSRKPRCST